MCKVQLSMESSRKSSYIFVITCTIWPNVSEDSKKLQVCPVTGTLNTTTCFDILDDCETVWERLFLFQHDCLPVHKASSIDMQGHARNGCRQRQR